MAKSQKRSARESRKPKSTEKKTKTPRYQMAGTMTGDKGTNLNSLSKK